MATLAIRNSIYAIGETDYNFAFFNSNGESEMSVDVLLEQNSYVEEINKHLKQVVYSTILNCK